MITSIGYDHTNMLGNTLNEIAIQKAGIIKENSHTVYVSQNTEIDKIVIEKCKETHNRLHLIHTSEITNLKYEQDKERFSYKQYKNIETNLKGKRQVFNAAIALECCDILKEKEFKIREETMREGLKTVIHKGRFEVIHQNPMMIFDGGHNEQAIENLKGTIEIYYKKAQKIYVISILKSKDYKKILEDIIEEDSIYIFTNGNDKKRFTDNHLMFEYAKQIKDDAKLYEMELEEAIQYCKEKTEYVWVIIGSFYIYEDVKKYCDEIM